MSPDEIEEAQSPIPTWDRQSRPFAHVGDPPPAWSDFHDPLDAIAARFRPENRGRGPGTPDRFSPEERKAMRTLQLADDADRKTLRTRYAELVRRYHPDRNGGDRSHERALAVVIDAYTLLKSSRAFA